MHDRSGVWPEATRVFIRPDVLVLAPSGGSGTSVPRGPIAPDARQALDTLGALGHRVVITGQDREPLTIGKGDWLLTGEPGDCRQARRAGARSILVGANEDTPPGWPERCDLVAGSVLRAVMEVVAATPQTPGEA